MTQAMPPQGPAGGPPPEPKKWLVALLLAIFLGAVGADHFYLGDTKLGIIKLITCGGCGIWSIYDIIMIATGKTTDVWGRPLAKD